MRTLGPAASGLWRIDPTERIAIDIRNRNADTLEIAGDIEHGTMLDSCRHEMRAFAAAFGKHSPDSEIVRLSRTGREDDVLRMRPDQCPHPAARIVDHLLCA